VSSAAEPRAIKGKISKPNMMIGGMFIRHFFTVDIWDLWKSVIVICLAKITAERFLKLGIRLLIWSVILAKIAFLLL